MIAYKKGSMKAIVALAALMSMSAVRAMGGGSATGAQAWNDIVAAAVGGLSGYGVAKIFNAMDIKGKLKENPLAALVSAAPVVMVAAFYRKDVAQTLGGARGVALSTAGAVGMFAVTFNWESKGSTPEQPQGGIEVLPGKSRGSYY